MLVNALWFQFNWFGLILFQSAFMPVAVLSIVVHFMLFRSSLMRDVRLGLLSAFVGLLVESLMMGLDVIVFTSDSVTASSTIAPSWIVALWFVFGLTLNHSLRIFRGHPIISLFVGALVGPLSYVAGIQFGAADNGVTLLQLYLCYALVWGTAFGLLTRLISDKETAINLGYRTC